MSLDLLMTLLHSCSGEYVGVSRKAGDVSEVLGNKLGETHMHTVSLRRSGHPSLCNGIWSKFTLYPGSFVRWIIRAIGGWGWFLVPWNYFDSLSVFFAT